VDLLEDAIGGEEARVGEADAAPRGAYHDVGKPAENQAGDVHARPDLRRGGARAAGAASGEEETCQSDGKAACGTEEETCLTEGGSDDAKAFCEERKKMCEKQVLDKCVADHKSALEASKKECEEADKENIKTCIEEGLEAKETEALSKCEEEKKESCPKDCGKKCDTEKLVDCLEGLETENDETEMFCTDFWKLLHSSSQVDPESGEPIVLLGNHTVASKR